MKYIYGGVITLLFAGVLIIPSAHAETTAPNAALLTQIQTLMAKIEELQKQLAAIRGEVKTVLNEGLSEGMTNADIAKLQELLATDPTIYPEGKKTGYFGPLTKEAVKRFQARHKLEITGKVDEETKDMLEEYLREDFSGKIPAGLLRAPGISKKVEDRFLLGCDKRHGGGMGMGPLCKKWKAEHKNDSDDEENDDDTNKNEDVFHVEVEIEDGDTSVSFKFENKRYELDVDGTDLDDVLEEVASELDVDVEDIDEDLADEIESELNDAEDEANDTENFDVEIEIEDGQTTVSFEFDNDDYEFKTSATDEDTILEKVANKLDVDVEDIDEDLADAISEALADAK